MLRRGVSVNRARKLAMFVCAVCVTPIVFASNVTSMWIAVALVGLAAAAHQGWSANTFTLASDLFPRSAVASVVGLGGMAGAIGGMLIATATGWVLELTGSYRLLFTVAGRSPGTRRVWACRPTGLFGCLFVVLGLTVASAAADEPLIVPLWPEGVPDARPDGGDERVDDGRVYNVQVPTLTAFPARAGAAVSTAVIVCPGGSYGRLAVAREGSELVKRLNAFGVSAFVLKYRLVEYGHPAPLRDVLRAIRIVRSRAGEFGVRPDRIGVLGSSAGGHLAACAATLFDDPEGRTGAPLDAVCGRPDFVALLYPVITMAGPFAHALSRRNLIGEHPAPALVEHLSLENQVTGATPPAFLIHTAEDTAVPLENSLLFFQVLRRAGVPAELHLFEHGPHGFGTKPGLGPTSQWPTRLAEWLRSHGWLDPGR